MTFIIPNNESVLRMMTLLRRFRLDVHDVIVMTDTERMPSSKKYVVYHRFQITLYQDISTHLIISEKEPFHTLHYFKFRSQWSEIMKNCFALIIGFSSLQLEEI